MVRRAQRYIIVIVLVGLTCLFISRVPCGEPVPLKRDLSLFPVNIGEWSGREMSEQAQGLPVDTDRSLYRKYTNEKGMPLYLYIGYWGGFRQGSDVFSGNYIEPGYMWDSVKERERVIEVKGESFPVREVLFAKGDYNISLLYWYQTPRGVTTKRFRGRLLYGIDAILNRRTNVALVKIYTGPFSGKESTYMITDRNSLTKEVFLQLSTFLPFNDEESR
ncbi:MAG TPA: EpsI family protein [Nitrospirae bacterium]|nr:EpsI family protein [Nitrospirota bacterium]